MDIVYPLMRETTSLIPCQQEKRVAGKSGCDNWCGSANSIYSPSVFQQLSLFYLPAQLLSHYPPPFHSSDHSFTVLCWLRPRPRGRPPTQTGTSERVLFADPGPTLPRPGLHCSSDSARIGRLTRPREKVMGSGLWWTVCVASSVMCSGCTCSA